MTMINISRLERKYLIELLKKQTTVEAEYLLIKLERGNAKTTTQKQTVPEDQIEARPAKMDSGTEGIQRRDSIPVAASET